MVLDVPLLNTQHYKVRIKVKVEHSCEWSSAFSLQLGVVAIEKGVFRSPSTKVADFAFYLYMENIPGYFINYRQTCGYKVATNDKLKIF